jgi:hypothetical protein
MEREIHPAETALFVAASLRGYRLADVDGGFYGVTRRKGGDLGFGANSIGKAQGLSLGLMDGNGL